MLVFCHTCGFFFKLQTPLPRRSNSKASRALQATAHAKKREVKKLFAVLKAKDYNVNPSKEQIRDNIEKATLIVSQLRPDLLSNSKSPTHLQLDTSTSTSTQEHEDTVKNCELVININEEEEWNDQLNSCK